MFKGENASFREDLRAELDVVKGILNAHGRLGEKAGGMSGEEQIGLEGAEGGLMGLNEEYEKAFGGLRFV